MSVAAKWDLHSFQSFHLASFLPAIGRQVNFGGRGFFVLLKDYAEYFIKIYICRHQSICLICWKKIDFTQINQNATTMSDFVKKLALIFKICLKLKPLKILLVTFFYIRQSSDTYQIEIVCKIHYSNFVQPLRQKAF